MLSSACQRARANQARVAAWSQVAQSAPGSRTRFVAVELDDALAARAERSRRLEELEAALG